MLGAHPYPLCLSFIALFEASDDVGKSLIRKPRKPITTVHLRTISRFLSVSGYPVHDKYMLLAVCLTAYFGLIRVSEFSCSTTSSYDTTIHLLRPDITFNLDFSICPYASKLVKPTLSTMALPLESLLPSITFVL